MLRYISYHTRDHLWYSVILVQTTVYEVQLFSSDWCKKFQNFHGKKSFLAYNLTNKNSTNVHDVHFYSTYIV